MRTKKEIREEIRRKLKRQGDRERSRRSRRIHRQFYQLDAFRKSKCLLIYLSLPEEVDTLRVIQRCISMEKKVVVPKMDELKHTLKLRELWDLKRDLEEGPFGIPEPRTGRTRPVSRRAIDCAVVPGIAFDASGNRLGRGRGYFDKLLSVLPSSVTRVAFAFKFQIVDRLPVESHDRPVDIVLSS